MAGVLPRAAKGYRRTVAVGDESRKAKLTRGKARVKLARQKARAELAKSQARQRVRFAHRATSRAQFLADLVSWLGSRVRRRVSAR